MNIGIDIRSLIKRPLTGVGHYTASLLDALPGASPHHTWHQLVTGLKLPEDVRRASPTQLHIRVPNKILTATWALTPLPLWTKKINALDALLLPNIHYLSPAIHVPFAVTVHDVSFLHNPRFYNVKWRLAHLVTNIPRLLRRARRIITVSEFSKSEIHRYFPWLKDSTVVVIQPALPETGGDVPAVLSLPQNDYILFVGTLEPRKNIPTAIQAFLSVAKKYKDVTLVLAGSRGWLSRDIVQMIDGNPRIQWLDYVTPADKLALYQHARVFIWPSLYEGFGFPPLESLRAGTPVITSYRTSLPEILGAGAIYVNPHNVYDVAAALDYTLSRSSVHLPPAPALSNSWASVAKKVVGTLESMI